jgi:hypothetical protein
MQNGSAKIEVRKSRTWRGQGQWRRKIETLGIGAAAQNATTEDEDRQKRECHGVMELRCIAARRNYEGARMRTG